MTINPVELFKNQAAEHLMIARKMRKQNQSLKRWTYQATQREQELIPAHINAARKCNHLSIEWKRRLA